MALKQNTKMALKQNTIDNLNKLEKNIIVNSKKPDKYFKIVLLLAWFTLTGAFAKLIIDILLARILYKNILDKEFSSDEKKYKDFISEYQLLMKKQKPKENSENYNASLEQYNRIQEIKKFIELKNIDSLKQKLREYYNTPSFDPNSQGPSAEKPDVKIQEKVDYFTKAHKYCNIYEKYKNVKYKAPGKFLISLSIDLLLVTSIVAIIMFNFNIHLTYILVFIFTMKALIEGYCNYNNLITYGEQNAVKKAREVSKQLEESLSDELKKEQINQKFNENDFNKSVQSLHKYHNILNIQAWTFFVSHGLFHSDCNPKPNPAFAPKGTNHSRADLAKRIIDQAKQEHSKSQVSI